MLRVLALPPLRRQFRGALRHHLLELFLRLAHCRLGLLAHSDIDHRSAKLEGVAVGVLGSEGEKLNIDRRPPARNQLQFDAPFLPGEAALVKVAVESLNIARSDKLRE